MLNENEERQNKDKEPREKKNGVRLRRELGNEGKNRKPLV